MVAEQKKKANERVQYDGPITPTIVVNPNEPFKVKIEKHEVNTNELSPSFQVRMALKTVPVGKDENGNDKNALTWHPPSNLWVAMNTYKDKEDDDEPTAHCISMREWWNHPQVDAVMQDPDLIKDVRFVDRVGKTITLDEAFTINDAFGKLYVHTALRIRTNAAFASNAAFVRTQPWTSTPYTAHLLAQHSSPCRMAHSSVASPCAQIPTP